MLPLALLWWFVWGMAVIENGIAGAPDLVSFHDALDAWQDGAFTILFGAVMSLWLSGVLIQSEHGDGTIEFLDSLPTTRSRVFASKVAAGLVLLWSGPVVQVAAAYAFDAASRSSVAETPPIGIVLPWAGLVCVQLTVLFSLAIALSFLRRFQWLAAGMLMVTYFVLDRFAPAVRVFKVGDLTDGAVEGGTLAVPWRLVAAQVPLAAMCLGAAWLLYRGLGDRLLDFGRRLGDSALGRIAVVGVTIVSVALWIVVPSVIFANRDDGDGSESDDKHTVRYESWGRSRATTRFYTFTYPTSVADRAQEFAARADAVHDLVATWFEAEPIGRIDVDATGAGPAMFAGRAFHESMQIDLAGAASVDDAIATLAHETSHLYIDAISDRRLSDEFRWGRAIHEGLANHLEHTLVRPAADLNGVRLSAALAHAWKPIEFEKFLDDEALVSERDPMIVYTVGEVLVAALIEVHGEKAPVRLLRAFGRPDRPQGVHGLDRWRDAFQSANFDMETVVLRFQRMLDEEVRARADVIATLPRLRGRHAERQSSDGVAWVGITPVPSIPVPVGWEVRVRFRRSASDQPDDYITAYADASGCYEILRSQIPGRRASYQIGIGSPAARAEVWETWQDVSLGR